MNESLQSVWHSAQEKQVVLLLIPIIVSFWSSVITSSLELRQVMVEAIRDGFRYTELAGGGGPFGGRS